jgi:hypothetical protein
VRRQKKKGECVRKQQQQQKCGFEIPDSRLQILPIEKRPRS